MQKFQTTIFFKCPKCKVENTVDVDVPEFSWASFDRMSDVSSEGYVDVVCPNPECEEDFGGYAHCYASGSEIVLDGDEGTFQGDCPMYAPEPNEWTDYGVPEHPHDIFSQSYTDMFALLSQKINSDDEQILQRMIFTQTISAMEAYMCDTLIKAICSNNQYVINICKDFQPLKDKAFNLAQMASISQDLNGFIIDHVKTALKRVLYHDIDRVSRLYKKGLDVKLIESKDDIEKLKEAIAHRHDCVHRNGFTRDDGVKNEIFTNAYVNEIMVLIKKIVDDLESKIPNSRPF
jgi:hypothetical protein